MTIWRGKGRKLKDVAAFVAEESFWFGGREVPKGSAVKQWEGRDFGWTCWIEPGSDTPHLAKE